MQITRPVSPKGQVVIPKDIRKILGLSEGKSEIIFEIENDVVKLRKKDKLKILEEFCTIARTGKDITQEDLEKIEEDSYDLS